MQHVRSWVKRREYLFSYKDQSILRQWIERYWIDVLSPSQFKVLTLIVSRTIGWGKMWETIPMRHFTDGAIRRTFREGQDNPITRMTFRGSGLTEPTVRKAIQDLIEQGFIRRKPHRDTFRYAVAWQRMGTAQDPVIAAIDSANGTDALAAEIQGLQREYRGSARQQTRSEGGQNSFPLSNEQQHSPNGEFMTSPTGKSRARESEENPPDAEGSCDIPAVADIPAEQQRTDDMPAILPPRREKKPRSAPLESETPEVPAERVRRVDAVAIEDEASRELLAATRQRLPTISGPLTQEYTDRIQGELSFARRKKALQGKETIEKLETLWFPMVFRATGQKAPKWSGKHRESLRRIMANMELPGPHVRWGNILEWIAECYGDAVALSVPFMLRDENKRVEILERVPSITLFLAFADHFATAYVRNEHGQGFSREVWDFAGSAQAQHIRAMDRARIAKQHGKEAIPVPLMTVKELLTHAERLAETDPEIRRLMAERAALQAIAAATKGAGAAGRRRADEAVRAERASIAVERGRDQRDRIADELGIPTYSDDPDDYHNEG